MSHSPGEEARKRQRKQEIQRQLDEALEATFPASDPISIVTPHGADDWEEEDAPGTDPPAVRPAAPARE